MFNLLRHYAITSFISVVVAAVLLAAFYRQLEIEESIELVQKSDSILAENILNSVRPQLGDYLKSVSKLGPQDFAQARFPTPLASALTESMTEASVSAVKIYNALGVVVFSTLPGQTGAVEATRTGFIAASNGKALTDLVYHDTFNGFGPRTPQDTLAQTYVPVRRSRSEPIDGVFVIYTDLSPLVARNEHEVFTVIAGIVSILALLYGVLLFTVLRAQRIIAAQQATIRDRTQSLEALSAQMLDNEEIEKKRLATGLHEDLAQTLSAIKIRIEDRLDPARAQQSGSEPLTSAVSALRGVVEELQQTAMELHPSSLEELGLLPTIHWYCRDAEQLHPGVRIERQISVQEKDIPASLKTVIYRIIESVLKDIAASAHADQIELALGLAANTLTLTIDEIPRASTGSAPASAAGASDPRLRFVLAQERTTLSGGTFSTANNKHAGIALRAKWTLPLESTRSRRNPHDTGSLGHAA